MSAYHQVVTGIDLPLPSKVDEGNKVNIEMNASHICVLHDNLVNISSWIDQNEMSEENVANLSNSIQQNNLSVTNRIDSLNGIIDALNSEPLNVTDIHLFLEHLDQETDILALYQELQKMVTDQITVRQALESSLQSFEEKVDYLEYVNSMLPQECM